LERLLLFSVAFLDRGSLPQIFNGSSRKLVLCESLSQVVLDS
jgi:hypothetical protein